MYSSLLKLSQRSAFKYYQSVAQPGSVIPLEGMGRRFKSYRTDQTIEIEDGIGFKATLT